MKRLILITLILLVVSSGCSDNKSTPTQETQITDTTDTLANIKTICTSLCQERLERNMDISKGPCLTDPLAMEDDWVCDIVHNPRTEEDNNEENQCQAYITGKASHFIELDMKCNIINIQ